MKINSISKALKTNQLYLTSSIVFVFTIILLSFEVLSYRSYIIDRVAVTSELISRNIEPALIFEDRNEMSRVLKTLKAESEIVTASIYDSKNKLMVSTKDGVAASIESKHNHWTHLESHLFYYYHEILDNDKKILGSLVLLISIAPFLTTLLGILSGTIIFSILAVLISQFVMDKLTSKVVVPIKSLGVSMASISQSKNYELSIIEHHLLGGNQYSEITILVNEFEHLLGIIRSSSENLIKMNQNLENLVSQRTSERDIERLKAIQSGKIAALGAMSAGIAHEINNPLAAIKVSSDILNLMINEKMVDEKILNKVSADINNMVERISTIIRGLRSFTRDGSQDPLVETDLFKVIQDTLIFVKNRYSKNNVALEINITEGEMKVMCRSSQIGQVVLNLLNNAYDAIEQNTIKWVKVDSFTEKNKIGIYITDSGNGIPEEILARLFEPFYTTKELGKGTGIGLSISASIMEANNGKLRYDRSCKNTRFRIEFDV